LSEDQNPGHHVAIFFGGLTLLAIILMFSWLYYRDPDGALDAWLDGERLIVRELRLDEGDEVERIAVVELRTGKRLADRSPGYLRPFAVRGDKIWLEGRDGIEAWTTSDLKSVTLPKLPLANTNLCFDRGYVRLALTDGRYAVLDLVEAKQVPDRPVTCDTSGRGNSGLQSTTSYGSSEREGDSQRMALRVRGARFGGSETFLEPYYVENVEADGDVFVVHRAQLGDNREMLLSRVGQGAKKWSVPLGDCGSTERVLWAPPVLVLVGHHGIDTVDVTTGAALWRTGK
jgi:hypothetical protein